MTTDKECQDIERPQTDIVPLQEVMKLDRQLVVQREFLLPVPRAIISPDGIACCSGWWQAS
jgi:hypothetical protein